MDFLNDAQVFDSSKNAVCLSKYINIADPAGSCYVEGLGVENAFGSAWGEPNRNIRTTWAFTDTVTKTIRNNTVEAGVDLYHQWADTLTQYPAEAAVQFSGYTGDSGFGLADFLLGRSSSNESGCFPELSHQRLADGPLRPGSVQTQAESQTVTAGLRWAPFLPPDDVNGAASFIPGQESQRYPNAPRSQFPWRSWRQLCAHSKRLR